MLKPKVYCPKCHARFSSKNKAVKHMYHAHNIRSRARGMLIEGPNHEA